MTIAFPRRMPLVGGLSHAFELERVDYDAPEAGGALGGISAGMPRWMLRMTYNNLRPAAAAELGAWLDAQRGSQRTFLAFDPDRRRPLFYQSGRPFVAAPSSWSQSINGDGLALLTLNGLNANQVVSTRDYVGFSWSTQTRFALTRSLERVVANAAGVATFAVEPPVPPVVPGDAAIALKDACCLMKLVPGESKLAESRPGYHEAGSIIVGRQTVIA